MILLFVAIKAFSLDVCTQQVDKCLDDRGGPAAAKNIGDTQVLGVLGHVEDSVYLYDGGDGYMCRLPASLATDLNYGMVYPEDRSYHVELKYGQKSLRAMVYRRAGVWNDLVVDISPSKESFRKEKEREELAYERFKQTVPLKIRTTDPVERAMDDRYKTVLASLEQFPEVKPAQCWPYSPNEIKKRYQQETANKMGRITRMVEFSANYLNRRNGESQSGLVEEIHAGIVKACTQALKTCSEDPNYSVRAKRIAAEVQRRTGRFRKVHNFVREVKGLVGIN